MRTQVLLATSIIPAGRQASNESPIAVNLNGKRYDRIYSYMPAGYSHQNFYALLLRLEREGLLARSDIGGERIARITPKGVSHLKTHDGLVGLAAKPWDERWRIALYNIPEKEGFIRIKIRLTLERFGLRKFHESLYVSPHPIETLVRDALANLGLIDMVHLLVASTQEFGDAARFALATWDLEALQKSYESLLRRVPIVMGQQIQERRQSGLRRIKSDFISLVQGDPMLPQQLLPANWPFRRVLEMLEKV